ncbi:MAG: winged helix DNA-binding protein [Lachnospiraceae bacterium]|nr:winged helix DNA-binding protein [Lachnospiraceae bacterium]
MEEEKQTQSTEYSADSSRNHELMILLQQCGHFLYHRRNGGGGQRRILILLGRWEKEHGREEGMSQQELQRQLGIRSGSISEILGKMEAKGLLKKARLSSDKRKICIFLTEEGRDRLESKRAENLRTEAALFQRLTEEERQELRYLLEKLLNAWKTDFDFQLPQRREQGESGTLALAEAAEPKSFPEVGKEPPCGNI